MQKTHDLQTSVIDAKKTNTTTVNIKGVNTREKSTTVEANAAKELSREKRSQ